MTLYGDVEAVKVMLRADEGIEFKADIDQRLTAIQAAISLLIDEATGRTFGVAGADATELVWAGPGDVIVLPRPARTVTSVTYGGTLAGTTITDGTDILNTDIVHAITDRDGLIYAIRTPYTWQASTPLAITATWADSNAAGDDAVPADITYTANYLIAETFKKEKASPAGFLGPEGVVPIRDAWSDPVVKRTIDKYRVLEVVV